VFLNKDIPNKVIPNKDIPNNKDILNNLIPNKDILNNLILNKDIPNQDILLSNSLNQDILNQDTPDIPKLLPLKRSSEKVSRDLLKEVVSSSSKSSNSSKLFPDVNKTTPTMSSH
jgi:hypothetical protein